jgi:hypothetical protein
VGSFLFLIAIKTIMASRFVVADNDVLEELKNSSENLNTRKVMGSIN